MNTDQALIQIKRLEKVKHIDSAQRSQTDSPLIVTDGPPYISCLLRGCHILNGYLWRLRVL